MTAAKKLEARSAFLEVGRVERVVPVLRVRLGEPDEGLDEIRAGTVDVRADDLASVRGENTIVSARELAKVDGKQIHIG